MNKKLNKTVLRLQICKYPVGLGANLVTIFFIILFFKKLFFTFSL